jgi:hypothetical protein
MHVQEEVVVESQKQLLSVGCGLHQDVPVQAGGTLCETPLGAARPQAPADEHILELACQPVDGMAFRHYSTISPVVS